MWELPGTGFEFSKSELFDQSEHEFFAQPHHPVVGSSAVYLKREVRDYLAGVLGDGKQAENWIARVGSIVSTDQRLNKTHPRNVDLNRSVIGYRAPRYGRAAIFESALAEGLSTVAFEVKGCGVAPGKEPGKSYNNNGFLFLHLALVEVINEKILNRVFGIEGVDVSCVPLLGIVDLGFDSPGYFGCNLPVGTLVRQCHVRPKNNNELPQADSEDETVKEMISELLLRHGMTSCGLSTSISASWEEGKMRLRHGGVLRTEVTTEHIEKLGQYLKIEAPFSIYPTNIQMAAGAKAAPLRARIVDLSHFKAHILTSGYFATLVDDRPLNLNRVSSTQAERNTPPTGCAIDFNRLKGVRMESDPRFEAIRQQFPKMNPDGAMVSGATMEALYLTAWVRSENPSATELETRVNDFVGTCFL